MKDVIARILYLAIGTFLIGGLNSCNQQAQLTFSLNASPTPTAIQQPPPAQERMTPAAPTEATNPNSRSSSTYYAGPASGGQSINVDLNSISRAAYPIVEFVYFLGNEQVQSQADCNAGTWTTFPEQAVHSPQSQATQKMLNFVCGETGSTTAQAGAAIVYDPPSNVRSAPNGPILCSVRERITINVYGSTGSWYNTDVCGQMGVIDASQIRF